MTGTPTLIALADGLEEARNLAHGLYYASVGACAIDDSGASFGLRGIVKVLEDKLVELTADAEALAGPERTKPSRQGRDVSPTSATPAARE